MRTLPLRIRQTSFVAEEVCRMRASVSRVLSAATFCPVLRRSHPCRAQQTGPFRRRFGRRARQPVPVTHFPTPHLFLYLLESQWTDMVSFHMIPASPPKDQLARYCADGQWQPVLQIPLCSYGRSCSPQVLSRQKQVSGSWSSAQTMCSFRSRWPLSG